MGRVTLEQPCTDSGIDVESALRTLEDHGIAAEPGQKLKDIAEETGKTTTEIGQLLDSARSPYRDRVESFMDLAPSSSLCPGYQSQE